MKVASLVFATLASVVQAKQRPSFLKAQTKAAEGGDINAGSDLGKRLLSRARRANDYNDANGYKNYFEYGQQNGYYYGNKNYGNNNNNQNNNNNNQNDNDNNANNNNNNGNGYKQQEWQWYQNYMLLGSSWLTQYSIKFQGCYDTLKWNYDALDAEDVRLMSRHIVRFRLCPADKCMPGYSDGCDSQYGDYIIDLNSYLEAYVEAKQAYQEWYVQEDADEYQANQYAGYDYYDDNFEVANYMQCTQTDIELDMDDYAQVYYEQMYNNNNNNNNNQNYAGYYYIGPYCAEQGGAILLGMFKDDACSIQADSSGGKQMYLEKTGFYLPFSERSLIEYDCMACQEPQGQYEQYNQNNGDDADDPDYIQNFCEVAYLKSGKCETYLPKNYFNMYKQKNNKSCNYLEGIKVIQDDGSIKTTNRSSPGHLNSRGTGIFLIAFFTTCFAGLAYYVYTLKSKFDRASVDLE